MLDINYIRENSDKVKVGMTKKKIGDPETVDRLLDADTTRRELLTQLQDLQAKANEAAKDIGTAIRDGRKDDAEKLKEQTAKSKAEIKNLEQKVGQVQATFNNLLLDIPNIPHSSVPVGSSAEDNKAVFTSPELPSFAFETSPHWEIVERLNLIDFDRGSKVTGAGFPFYIGKAAKLQRALINFFLDSAVSNGYTEVQAPLVVNSASAHGTGQLPDKEDMMYEVTRDELYLIPTAEVPVTNYYRDEILSEDDLPVKQCAYTPCFRREAGSYGKDVRGLNRLHQFDKVELVQLVDPQESYDVLEEMRDEAEALLTALQLPYRRLLMCTADLGFTQAKKYDLEVWSAAQERWLEVSSISNFEAFQARRMKIRYRKGDSRPEFVHSLNGSALALPRIVAALLENGQQKDGSVALPEEIVKYTGFARID